MGTVLGFRYFRCALFLFCLCIAGIAKAGLEGRAGEKPVFPPSATNPLGEYDLAKDFQKRLAITRAQLPATGIVGKARRMFYSYDPIQGTTTNYWRCAACIMGSAGVGAVITERLSTWLPMGRKQFQNKVIESGAKYIDQLVEENPLVCGAVAGTVASTWVLWILGSSLKPTTEEGIHLAREYIVDHLLKNYQTVAFCNRDIGEYLKEIESLQKALINEQTVLQHRHQQSLQRYNNQFDVMVQRLASAAHDWVRYHDTREAQSVSDEDVAKAVAVFAKYMSERNNSYYKKEKLVAALEPVIPREQLSRLRSALSSGPGLKPSQKVPTGPVGKQYQQYKSELSSTQDDKEDALRHIKDIFKIYPGLIPLVLPATVQLGNIPDIPLIPSHVLKASLPD